jgi:hypothetical protein
VYQDYIEERNRDIRKQLARRSKPTSRGTTYGTTDWRRNCSMQQRRKQREEQATEIQITTTETEQQQGRERNKDDLPKARF